MLGTIFSPPVNVGSNSSTSNSISPTLNSFCLKDTYNLQCTLERTSSNFLPGSPSGKIKDGLIAATEVGAEQAKRENPFTSGLEPPARCTPTASTTFKAIDVLPVCGEIGNKIRPQDTGHRINRCTSTHPEPLAATAASTSHSFGVMRALRSLWKTIKTMWSGSCRPTTNQFKLARSESPRRHVPSTLHVTDALSAGKFTQTMGAVVDAPKNHLVDRAPPEPQAKPVLRTSSVQDVMKEWGVSGVFDDNTEGASVFAEWAHRCNARLSEYNPKRKAEMIKVWEFMAKDSVLQNTIFAIAAEELGHPNEEKRYQRASTRMEKPYLEAEEKISGMKITHVMSALPCYASDAPYKILGDILKKPPQWAVEKAQSCDKLSVTDIIKTYSAEGYPGTPKGFVGADSVKKYLNKALARAPEKGLNLVMGYRNDKDEGKVGFVDVRVKTTKEGHLLFRDWTGETELYRVPKDGMMLYKDISNGKVVAKMDNKGHLFSPYEESLGNHKRPLPQLEYKLCADYSKDTELRLRSLSKLASCREFWIYETDE